MKWLIFITLLCLVPLLTHLQGERHRLLEIEEEMGSLCRTIRKQVSSAGAQFSDANRYYIDQELEKLPLLERETAALQQLVAEEPSVPSRDLLRRMEELESNQISFAEGAIERHKGFTETGESLSRPVELDTEDLQTLLGRIEGDVEGKPQLLITDCTLSRKKGYGDNETLLLDLKMLKREFQ
jgi:BMFP domain-containing protein YqiC